MSPNENLGPIVSSNSYLKSVLLPFQNNLNVAHLNCRSIKPPSKFDEIKSILKDNTFDLFAISETWLSSDISDRSISIPGYKLCRNDRQFSARGGGVGVFISNGLHYKPVFKISVSHCESLFLELCFGGTKLLLGVVYLPSGNLDEFENFHSELFSSYENVVVLGDFNCNLFNPSKANTFRSICTRYNLSIVHNTKPTHFDLGKRTTSLIDFMVVSDMSLVSYTDQVQCPSVSDHALIFASLSFRFHCGSSFYEYRDYNNIDWDGLFLYLRSFDTNVVLNATDVDTKCSYVCSLLSDLFSYVPIVRKRIRVRGDDWFEAQDIRLARSLRDLAFSAFQFDRSNENWRTYCKYRNRAKNIIRKVKRKYFSSLFWGLDSAGLWKALRSSGCAGSDDVRFDLDVNNVNNFFADLAPQDSAGYGIDFECFDDSNDSFSFRCVNEFEVIEALSKVKSKAVGVDGIPISFVKSIFSYISCVVVDLINSILMTSIFPLPWKKARVVPIPKSKIVHEPDDLRPIAILPALSKVVEHIIKDQILQYCSNDINNSQYAYRQGHNTTHLLLKMTDSIREQINDGNLSILVSLDLSKAFNSIDFVRLIDKLCREFKFSKSACKLVYSYLCARSQFVVLNGAESATLPLRSGVPQGSVLGPLLFILYVNDFLRYTDSRTCKTWLFADDIFLLFNGNHASTEICEGIINDCLENVVHWASINSLTINPSKTKAIMFGSPNRTMPNLHIFLRRDEVEFVNQHRCLGVVIDCELSFKFHIDTLSGRVWSSLRKIYSSNIYLPLRVKQRLAHALLMSQVLYGFEVVTGTIGMHLNKLNRIVNTITRFVYNVNRRVHISGYVKRFIGCSFTDFVNYRNLSLFYAIMKIGRPITLCNLFSFSRFTRSPQIYIPRICCNVYSRSFLVRIARCWNSLPHELRVFSLSNNIFRFKLLEHFNA